MVERKILSSQMSVGGAPGATYELYEDPARVEEKYVDGVQGVMVSGSIVKLNFFSRGFSPPAAENGVEERYTVCRLAMGTDTFQAILEFFDGLRQELPWAATSSSSKDTLDAQ